LAYFAYCDREGRFQWRPRQLKLDVLPYDDVDFTAVLDALAQYNFIIKYSHKDKYYGCIPSWHKHQQVNNRELESQCPDPEQADLQVEFNNEVKNTTGPRPADIDDVENIIQSPPRRYFRDVCLTCRRCR